jgi:hypothetical protein
MSNTQTIPDIAPAVKYRPTPKSYYFDVALGSILLSGEDTGGAYCLLDLKVAFGMSSNLLPIMESSSVDCIEPFPGKEDLSRDN